VTRNLITDVPGVRVGNASDAKLASGTTVVLFDQPASAAVDVRGGGPGTRESDLLDPAMTVQGIDAVMISGGSAYGLDAASGVQAWMREHGRGFVIGDAIVPIVPGAVLFDLLNGGDKKWGLYPPYRELGYQAAASAGLDFRLGTEGAGFGATVVDLKGGLGSASAQTKDGITVGAIAAVNAVGSAVIDSGPHFWAAPVERGREFGGRGQPTTVPESALTFLAKGGPQENTTLVVVATDATLTKAQARRLAIMAQDGFARALRPVHTPLDGDIVFAAATCKQPFPEAVFALAELGTLAADVVARAIARGVYEATALPFPGALPAWKDKFG
jgi:L-aminopeptidase/D-esterase-like protein